MNSRTFSLAAIVICGVACSSKPTVRSVGAVDASATGVRSDAATSGDTYPGCWVEIFEGDNFTESKLHARIQGPAAMPTLDKVNGANWKGRIQSIVVGPEAQVALFDDKHMQGDKLVIGPGRRVHTLKDYDFDSETLSMEITYVAHVPAATTTVGSLPPAAPSAGSSDTWIEVSASSGGYVAPIRIYGPIELRELADVGGRDLRNRIVSVRVGPDARATLYNESDFQGRSLSVGANRSVDDLKTFELKDDVESIKIAKAN